MIYTTLNKIREHDPCTDSWEDLLKSLGKTKGDDDPLSMEYIFDTLGFDDCLWACRSLPEYDREWRLLACDFAENVLHIYEKQHPNDDRVRNCIETSRRFAIGEVGEAELSAARAASWAAAREASWAAAREASWAAAREASWAAATKKMEAQLRVVLAKGGE